MLSIAQFTCHGEDFEVKLNLFRIPKEPFLSETGQQIFVIFLPKFSRNDYQKNLVPFQTNTFNEVIFSGKLSILLVSSDFERENSGSVFKKQCTLTEELLRKVVFTSKDLILDNVFSLWTKLLGFWPQFFNRNVNTAISASRWSTSGEKTFFSKKLSILYYIIIFRTKSLDIQLKKS